MRLAGRSVIATARRNPARAAHERHVLRALADAGAPVPAVLAWGDGWLIQEDLGAVRLTGALASGDAATAERALDAALAALARCHEAGRASGLAAAERGVIGADAGWRAGFAAMPGRLGAAAGLAPPPLDAVRLAARVWPPSVRFVKWDARPGNAVLRADGSVAWFDWEHAGRRAPLDDLAWLLGDEYLGDRPAVEAALLARWLGAFADGLGEAEARDYLATMLCLHACVRLALIVSWRQRDGRWWDLDRARRNDRVGVDAGLAAALCSRAGRWAEAGDAVRPLAGWFGDLSGWLRALP